MQKTSITTKNWPFLFWQGFTKHFYHAFLKAVALWHSTVAKNEKRSLKFEICKSGPSSIFTLFLDEIFNEKSLMNWMVVHIINLIWIQDQSILSKTALEHTEPSIDVKFCHACTLSNIYKVGLKHLRERYTMRRNLLNWCNLVSISFTYFGR